MSAFFISQLRHRSGRVVATGVGVLVAAVAFTLLSSAATTSELRIRGTLNAHFRSAYDILVRPKGLRTRLERQRGLVQPNFMGGLFGGITVVQWRSILRTPGVEVAAPLANVGYVLVRAPVEIPLGRFVTGERDQLFRVRLGWRQNGSLYPGNTLYVYVTRRPGGCAGLNILPPARLFVSPFATAGPANTTFRCYAPGGPVSPISASWSPPDTSTITAHVGAQFPLLIGAVDPAQEQKLLQIDRTIVDGLGLRELGGYSTTDFGPFVPVLASTRAFTDVNLAAGVERVEVPAATSASAMLTPERVRGIKAVENTERAAAAPYRRVNRLPSTPLGTERFAAGLLYKRALDSLSSSRPEASGIQDVYWSVTPVQYGSRREALVPRIVRRDPALEFQAGQIGSFGFTPVPPGNDDVQFRHVVPHHIVLNDIGAGQAEIHVAGRFDPTRIPTFDPLVRVPLASYRPPLAEPADTKSRQALSGRPYRPSTNLGDYLTQPPFLLTTLQAARGLTSTRFFLSADERQARILATLAGKPPPPERGLISVVRVRVSDVTGADRLSLARIRIVAQRIQQQTGLDVDVTAGSSPTPVTVRLPEGKFGRPALTLTEGWSRKGATLAVLEAVDRKSLALVGLFLLVSGFFLANSTLASVRTRRREIGTLLCLGWTRGAIMRALLAEVLIVGLVAGAVGTALAIGLIELFDFDLSLARALTVLPVAVALALVSGFVPAWWASRSAPLAAVHPPVVTPGGRRRVRRFPSLAFANLTRLPARTLLGATGLAIGVAGLTVLVGIERSFHGTVVGTVLGDVVTVQVRDVDLVSVGLTIALAAIAVADLLYVNLTERAPELVTLRASGWGNLQLGALVELEGLGLAVAGSGLGATAGLGLATSLGLPVGPTAIVALAAALGGTLAVLIATLIPLGRVSRLGTPQALAAE